MSDKKKNMPTQSAATKAQNAARKEKLEAALKNNLRRRKSQENTEENDK